MIRLNLRFKRPEILPGGAGIPAENSNSNHQFRLLHDQFSRLSSDNLQLRQTLQRKNKLIQQLKTTIAQYEAFFNEQISQFQLQQSKIAVIDQTYAQLENFAKDIDNQLTQLINISPNQKRLQAISHLKRILLRFLHQKDFYCQQMEQELKNLDDAISQHQQILDKLRSGTGEILATTK